MSTLPCPPLGAPAPAAELRLQRGLPRLLPTARARERAARLRPALLAFVGEQHPDARVLEPFLRADRWTWAAVEPAVVSLLDQTVEGAAREALVSLLRCRGTVERARQQALGAGAGSRARAVDRLATIGAVETLPELLHLLGDRDPAVRAAAARGLGAVAAASSGSQRERAQLAAPELLARVAGPRPLPRGVVVDAVVARGAAAEDAVHAAAAHLHEDVRLTAVEVLARTGDPSAAEILSRVLGDDASLDVRVADARALGRHAAGAAVAPLLRAARSGQPLVLRRAAAAALGKLADQAALDPLRQLLVDSQPELAPTAARALARLGSAGRRVLEQAVVTGPEVAVAAAAAVLSADRPAGPRPHDRSQPRLSHSHR